MKARLLVLFGLLLAVPGAVATASPNDYSGNGLNLNVLGTPDTVEATLDKWGEGYSFDGVGECLYGNLQTADRALSVTYYAVVTLPSNESGLMVKGEPRGANGVARGFGIGVSNSRIFVTWGDGISSSYQVLTGATQIQPGEVVSMAATFNTTDKTIKIYLNGELDGSTISAGQIAWTDTGTGPSPAQFYIAGGHTDTAGTSCNSFFVEANVFEVRTWNVVLPPETLQSLTDPGDCTYAAEPVGSEYRVYLMDDLVSVDCLESEPQEFDTGLVGFVQGLGFISAESLMLACIVCVGLVTVATGSLTKWMSPGRFKNYLMLGLAIGVGIFTGVLFNVELWMLTTGIILSIFIVRGGGEIRNTLHNIRKELQNPFDVQPEDPSEADLIQLGPEPPAGFPPEAAGGNG